MSMENKEVFSKNFRRFIEISGKDRKNIANALNLPYSTVTDWANGRKYPRIDNLEKLANYFGISKSELIEDFVDKEKDNDLLASIVVRLRMDRDLLHVVEKVMSLDKTRLESLSQLLDTFV